MRALRCAVLLLILVAAAGAAASAAEPTRLSVTAPPQVGLGDEITMDAHLTTADGRPVSGAHLALRQVGAVGERTMAEAVTDAHGRASFLHTEFTLAHLSLAVVFAGDARWAASRTQAQVEISGVEVPPSVVMAHTPDPLVKLIIFAILGTVWATYAFAASCVLRIRRARAVEEVRRLTWGR